MVVLEAMACGLPLVAPPVGGLAELLRDGSNGVACREPSVEAIAEGMQVMLMMRPAARKAMGLAGRALVESSYSLDAVVERWLTLYAAAIAVRWGGHRAP